MTITVQQLSPNQPWTLWVDGLGGKAIAGPRLFRAPPHPDVQFCHDTKEGAERDAEKLRAYLAQLPKQKKGKKKSTDRSAYD